MRFIGVEGLELPMEFPEITKRPRLRVRMEISSKKIVST